MSKPSLQLSLVLTAALALAGCQAAAPLMAGSIGAVPDADGATRSPARPATAEAPRSSAEKGASLGAPVVSNGSGALPAMPAPPVRASAPPASGRGSADLAAEAGGAMAPRTPVQEPVSDLKAGAVDDNKGFKAYLEYLARFGGVTNVAATPRVADVTRRKVLTVVDDAGKPVHDAEVSVVAMATPVGPGPDGEPRLGLPAPLQVMLRTYTDGRALFHPQPQDREPANGAYEVRVTRGEVTATASLDVKADALTIKLPAPVARQASGTPLDVAFVIDATGSMSGEIRKFQATMLSIAERIKLLPQAPTVRFGLVSYRDQKEAYVTRVKNFTASTSGFQAALDDVVAAGGGDKPEHMEEALRETVQTLEWTRQGAVRLSFLVADAAPHTDYEQSMHYTDSMRQAAAAGIKFYPIGASGLEPEGEYVMRQLAQWTMGQYLFVTRGGDEGTGGGGTASAEVDKFREGRLDDIVVDIVKAELSHLGQ